MILRLIGSRTRQRLHRMARKFFGLQITTVPERRFDMWNHEMNTTSARRFLHFKALLRRVENVDGRIVGCGVGPGSSIFDFSVISQVLTRPSEIAGFDTFKGMPPPTEEDGNANAHKTGWWRHSWANVVELLKYNGLAEAFIREKISFHPGVFEETLPKYDGSQIAFLHLDVDFYASYRTTLRELWPTSLKVE